MSKFTVGQHVWHMRRMRYGKQMTYEQIIDSITEAIVVKVGKKYIYVVDKNRYEDWEKNNNNLYYTTKFDAETFGEVSQYAAELYLYLSYEDAANSEKAREALVLLRNKLTSVRANKITYDKIKEAYKILFDEELTKR